MWGRKAARIQELERQLAEAQQIHLHVTAVNAATVREIITRWLEGQRQVPIRSNADGHCAKRA